MTERPLLAIDLNGTKKPEEQFMHQVLRPVLKQQHDVICECLLAEKHFDSQLMIGNNEKSKATYLTAFVQKNISLKNLLIGLVIGNFTAVEREFYWKAKKDLNKRIVDMAITRLLSHFE